MAPPDDPGNATVDFHGEKRTNEMHQSKTDPDAKLARKGKGKEAKLSLQRESVGREPQRSDRKYRGVRGQRNGGARCSAGDVGTDSRHQTGDCRRRQGIRHGGLRGRVPTPKGHAARGAKQRPGGSAIDARTTQHPGYAISQKKRKRIEECFGWLKTIALLRKVRHRGIFKVGWVFTFAVAAYNLVRMRNLAIQAP
jgi:Transposase DDE domain